MEEILEVINRANGVLGSAIVSSDGSMIVADFRDNIKTEDVLRCVEIVGKACERAVGAAGRGQFFRATLDGPQGRLLLYGIQGGFLAVFADRGSNVGLLRLLVERSVAQAQENADRQAA